MKYFENPKFSKGIEGREDFEGLQYQGGDSSLEIFPHLNLSWYQVKNMWEKTGKPVADLGASFSTLPVEGQLRGINIQPIDIMHMAGRGRYEAIVSHRMNGATISDRYSKTLHSPQEQQFMGLATPIPNYYEAVDKAIQKVKANFMVADIAHLPVADRHFSLVIVHDSVPKHSADTNIFFDSQLPEILRVTDIEARISPMALYKTHLYRPRDIMDDPEDAEDWIRVEGRIGGMYSSNYHSELEEDESLYGNPEHVKRLGAVANSLGFDLKLERGMSEVLGGIAQFSFQESDTGIFTRKK